MPGPVKEPTVLKLAKGNPGKVPLDKFAGEPTPEIGIPDCPEHLDDEARKEWAWISEHLYKEKLLSFIDKAMLALYCQAWSDWVRAENELKKPGQPRVVKSPTGYPMPNPWIGIKNNAAKAVHRFLREFGMSPSARTSVRVGKGQDGLNPWAEFMAKKNANKNNAA